MIDFKGKNSPLLTAYLLVRGFKTIHTVDGPCGADAKGSTNLEIDVIVQQIIDDFDPLTAAQKESLNVVDEIKKAAPWRPSPEDLQRLNDTNDFIKNGSPETFESGEYKWLVGAAETQGLTVQAMADFIISKHDDAYATEQARLNIKSQIREAETLAEVDLLLKNYTSSAKENTV